MNRDIPVELNTRELWVCSTHSRKELLDKGFQADTQRRLLSKNWFAL